VSLTTDDRRGEDADRRGGGAAAGAAPPGARPGAPSQAPSDALEQLPLQVLDLERRGLVTRTFRRLDPERQVAVIGAILAEAAAAGPRGVSVRGVAGRAAVAVGSLYQYFPDRSQMVGVAAEIAGGLLAADLARYRDDLTALHLRDGLVAYVTAGVEWSEAQADLLRFFARAAYQGDVATGDRMVAPVAAELLALVRAMLEVARERGEIAAGVDVEGAARFVHALTVALGDCRLLPHLDRYYRLVDGADLRQRAGELADFVLAALGSGSGQPRSQGEE